MEAVARARRAEAGQPAGADSDARARRRQRAQRERSDPDPPRPRPSRESLDRERAVAARAADPRPGLHRRQLLRRHRHPRLPERWSPDPDDAVRAAMQARGRARLHELWAMFADQFPATPWLSGEHLGALDILAATVSKWAARARRWPSRARNSPRCWRASTPSRASLRSGRGTGRRHERAPCARIASVGTALASEAAFAARLCARARAVAVGAAASRGEDELVGLINARRAEARGCGAPARPRRAARAVAARWRASTRRDGQRSRPRPDRGRLPRGEANTILLSGVEDAPAALRI